MKQPLLLLLLIHLHLRLLAVVLISPRFCHVCYFSFEFHRNFPPLFNSLVFLLHGQEEQGEENKTGQKEKNVGIPDAALLQKKRRRRRYSPF